MQLSMGPMLFWLRQSGDCWLSPCRSLARSQSVSLVSWESGILFGATDGRGNCRAYHPVSLLKFRGCEESEAPPKAGQLTANLLSHVISAYLLLGLPPAVAQSLHVSPTSGSIRSVIQFCSAIALDSKFAAARAARRKMHQRFTLVQRMVQRVDKVVI